MERACDVCGTAYEARRETSRYCSAKCRMRMSRAGEVSKPGSPQLRALTSDSGLVESVTEKLEEAGASSTFSGQLAIALARRLSDPEESGISSLSKELRTVMAAALGGVAPPAAEEADEVAKAREARERKARQAAGRA